MSLPINKADISKCKLTGRRPRGEDLQVTVAQRFTVVCRPYVPLDLKKIGEVTGLLILLDLW